MVGRNLPAQALLRLFEQARAGHSQIALVSGEAGIGKSRLLREVQTGLPASAVLQGNCFEADQNLPYAPIADLLRGMFAALPLARKQSLITGRASELVRLLPELAHDFPDLPAASSDSEAEKRRLHQALLDLFNTLSAAHPLLVIIEDLHWCDDASLEFLLFLARRMENVRLLLLMTFRDDEVAGVLAAFLAQLDRGRLATEFRLPRLTPDIVSIMMRAIFGAESTPPADFVQAVYTLSEGNPFFIEEMLKSLLAEGDIFLADGKWERKPLDQLHIPRTVQVSLRQRLSHLSSVAREVLSMAAVAGRRFDFTLLQHLTGRAELELLGLIRELKEAQFVVEENADIFAFRHALTRQAVYQEMFARERRALHQAIGLALEGDVSSGKIRLPDLAYHFYHAEEWEKAAQYGWEAGQYAEALYAPRAALEHYDHALKAFKQLRRTPPMPLLRARGKAHEMIGNLDAARDDYLSILAASRGAADRHFEWQSLLDLGFLYTGLDFAQAGRYLHDAITVARELGDPPTLAGSLNRLGNWYINQDLPTAALPYHQEALTIFQRLNDLAGQAATLDLLGVAGVVSGDVVSSAAYYDQAIALFRQLDNRVGLSSALAVTSVRGGSCMAETVYCPPTGLDFMLDCAAEARRIAAAVGWQPGEAAADMYVTYGLVTQGEYELGLICAQRNLEIATAANHTLYTAAAYMGFGRIYNDILAFEAARDALLPALETARAISGKFLESSLGGFLVSSWIGLGELDKAADLVSELRTESMQSVGQRIVRCAEAELALARDQAEMALSIIDHLVETAPNSAGQVIPKLCYLKASVLLIHGELEASRALLQEAAASAREANLQALLWRILILQGKVEQSAGRLAQAEEIFEDARDLIEQLAEKLSEAALRDQFLSRAFAIIPARPTLTPRQAARAAYDGLTEREREIAILIAAGKSSREIAEQLVLSKRTVDAHTANILGKLGFSSRTQIARWVVEKKLL